MKSLADIFRAAPEPRREPLTPEETAQALRLALLSRGNGVGQLSRMFARPQSVDVAPPDAPMDAKAAMRADEALSQLRVGEESRLERMRRLFPKE